MPSYGMHDIMLYRLVMIFKSELMVSQLIVIKKNGVTINIQKIILIHCQLIVSPIPSTWRISTEVSQITREYWGARHYWTRLQVSKEKDKRLKC
jgi:hypothetical protein